VGSPSIQNRQGYAVPSPPGPLTPTRGPVRIRAGSGASAAACTLTGLSGLKVSVPLTSPVSPSADASRAGPRARSLVTQASPRRVRAIASPSMTSPARMRTAEA
jgi:hypothetical protein